MGESRLRAKSAQKRPPLAEQRARAIDFARGVLRGHEGATDRQRYDGLTILTVMLEDRGHWPHQPFALDRERMATPPKRRNSYRPRKGALDRRGKVRERIESNVKDRWEGDEEVARLRARIGMPATRFQQAQALLKATGLLICNSFGRVKGRVRNIANAWEFGMEIANLLSKAIPSALSEEKRIQNRAKALSDFVKQGLKGLAQAFFSSLVVVEAERNAEKASAVSQAVTKGFGKGSTWQPSPPPAPSPGRAVLDPELPTRQEAERQKAEADLAALEAGGGALAGIKFLSFIENPDRWTRRR